MISLYLEGLFQRPRSVFSLSSLQPCPALRWTPWIICTDPEQGPLVSCRGLPALMEGWRREGVGVTSSTEELQWEKVQMMPKL